MSLQNEASGKLALMWTKAVFAGLVVRHMRGKLVLLDEPNEGHLLGLEFDFRLCPLRQFAFFA